MSHSSIHENYTLRPATPQDAPQAAALIALAYCKYSAKVCGSSDSAVIQKRLEFFFIHPKVSLIHYSHTQMLVSSDTGQVAGAMSSFRWEFAPTYFLNIAELLGLLRQETLEYTGIDESIRYCQGALGVYPGDYHLDVVAVHPDFQKQGLSRLLITKALRMAKEEDLTVLSLLARDEVCPWYRSLGFQEGERIWDVGEPYTRFFWTIV